MKEPTFLDFGDDMVEIIWDTKEKRLCVFIDNETGVEIFGISIAGELIEFDRFLGAYKWFEEGEK